MNAYFLSNGTDKDYQNRTDHWGQCKNTQDNPRCLVPPYLEKVSGNFGSDKMLIYEPCNYASNIAFYHSTTRICDYPDWSIDAEQQNSLKRSFAALAFGSSMWHGSHTFVGYSFDNNMIAVISYLAHQASVSGLPGNSTILKELSSDARNMTGVQVSEQLTNLFLKPVTAWPEVLNSLDLPLDYYITFTAFISTCLAVIFPFVVVETVVGIAANKILTLEDANFINYEYLPALKTSTENVTISKTEKAKIG